MARADTVPQGRREGRRCCDPWTPGNLRPSSVWRCEPSGHTPVRFV